MIHNTERTVHLSQSRLDAHVDGGKVGMRRHDADDAAGGGVQTRRDHTQDDIFAGEDARDGAVVLDQEGGGVVLLHEVRRLLDRGPDTDRHGGLAAEDGLEGGARHLHAQGLDVLDDLLGLAGAQLGLDALEGVVELAGGRVGPLELLHGVVEALGDVEDARDVLVLVHDGQVAEAFADHEVEGVGGAGVGAGAQGVLGHDLGDGDVGGLLAGADDTEGQVFGGEDAGDAVVVVGDQDAVLPLGGHQLGGLGDGGLGLDLEGLAGLEGEDGAGRGFARVSGPAGEVLLLGQVVLHLASDGLEGGAAVSVHDGEGHGGWAKWCQQNSPRPSWIVFAGWR